MISEIRMLFYIIKHIDGGGARPLSDTFLTKKKKSASKYRKRKRKDIINIDSHRVKRKDVCSS
jgi:hypothetical protein